VSLGSAQGDDVAVGVAELGPTGEANAAVFTGRLELADDEDLVVESVDTQLGDRVGPGGDGGTLLRVVLEGFDPQRGALGGGCG
jgi:hypothetical protein